MNWNDNGPILFKLQKIFHLSRLGRRLCRLAIWKRSKRLQLLGRTPGIGDGGVMYAGNSTVGSTRLLSQEFPSNVLTRVFL